VSGLEKMKKRVLYGWKWESVDEKIKLMLSLTLGKRYEAGIVKGELARILEKNQEKLNGQKSFRTIQILKQA